MNFLLYYEARLKYFELYHGRMGRFRPIRDHQFESVITGKQESLLESLRLEHAYYNNDNDFDGDKKDNRDSQDDDEKNAEGNAKEIEISVYVVGANGEHCWSFCCGVSEQEKRAALASVEKLAPLANRVARLYEISDRCFACGDYCRGDYCREHCRLQIPCDRCGRRRAPEYYNFDVDADQMYCKFCTTSSEHVFSIDTLISLVDFAMTERTKATAGLINVCASCNGMFMHERHAWEKDEDEEEDGKDIDIDFEHHRKKMCFSCCLHSHDSQSCCDHGENNKKENSDAAE